LKEVCKNTYIPNIVKLSTCFQGLPIPAYLSLYPGTPGLDIISKTATKYLNGAMCGISAYGITTAYSAGLVTVARLSSLESPSDGLVSHSSCVADIKNTFSLKAESNFYESKINHADATCRNKDGWFGSSRMPCLWYSLRS